MATHVPGRPFMPGATPSQFVPPSAGPTVVLSKAVFDRVKSAGDVAATRTARVNLLLLSVLDYVLADRGYTCTAPHGADAGVRRVQRRKRAAAYDLVLYTTGSRASGFAFRLPDSEIVAPNRPLATAAQYNLPPDQFLPRLLAALDVFLPSRNRRSGSIEQALDKKKKESPDDKT